MRAVLFIELLTRCINTKNSKNGVDYVANKVVIIRKEVLL